ncbi:response regulator [Pontibacter sp. Tf4]|uniref:response regulator n=1 Tax=Pontibacter sp. Tf4 TaxID=2761620 RepID=UPI0016245D31|nr:response regulator [Pontibacter sp. Tf4]
MYKLNHILIVDDDQINSLFSQIILEDANACQTVSVCHSTLEALELLRSIAHTQDAHFPDLILLDINMPELDGFDFLEQYHAQDYHRFRTLISMFSSSDDPEHLETIKNYSSVIGFIPKPLSMATLNNLLALHFTPPVNNLL